MGLQINTIDAFEDASLDLLNGIMIIPSLFTRFLGRMRPSMLKKESTVDPEVTKGYEATYSYTMRLFGLYPVLNGKLYYFFLVYQAAISLAYFWFVFAYLVSTYLAFAYNDEELIPYELCYGLLTMMYFLVAHTVLYRRKHLEGLFRDVGRGFYKYKYAVPFCSAEAAIREEADRNCKKLARINVIISFFLTTCVSVPAITKGLQGKYTTEMEGEVPVNKNLILPVWSPYPINTKTSFWCFFFIELAAANTESFIICANCTLYCNLCTMLGAEIKLLCHSLRKIEHRAAHVFETEGFSKPKSGYLYDSEVFQKCLIRCMNECIIHHIKLKKFLKKFQKFVSFPVFAILSGTALTISSPLFMLLSMDQNKDVFELIMKLVLYSFLVCSFAYFLSSYCMYGQGLTDDSSDVYSAFYDTPWMYCTTDFRRRVIMGMMNSRTPFVLSAAGIVSASGATLIEILKSVFSYLNILRAARR